MARTAEDLRTMPSPGVQRAAICAFAVVAALVVTFSGFDRASSSQPRLARFVPAPFAAQSLIDRANRQLESLDYTGAQHTAELAVLSGPIEPESTGILGSARLANGDATGAERAFLVAGHFGWRAPVTQYYWMQRALALGDYRVASLRLDAMLRQDPHLVSNRDLLDPLESSPEGRTALAQRLIPDPVWLPPYAQTVWDLPAEVVSRRAAVLDAVARAGKPLGCQDAGPMVTALVKFGQPQQALQLWREHCPGSGQTMLADGDFARLQVHDVFSPFDWQVIGDSDVSLSLADADRGRRDVVLASSAPFPRKILSQLAVLGAGNYRLSWAARTDAGAPSPRIAAAVSCRPDGRDWLPARYDAGSRRYISEFALDGQCQAYWVGFAILPGSESLRLGRISLQRLP